MHSLALDVLMMTARGKTIVFGIYKRNGRVHTDGMRTYDGIVQMGCPHHLWR